MSDNKRLPIRVLIADDEAEVRDAYREILSDADMSGETAMFHNLRERLFSKAAQDKLARNLSATTSSGTGNRRPIRRGRPGSGPRTCAAVSSWIRNGGTLGRLLPIFKLGFGVPLGSGDQYMSWISLADEVAAMRFLIDRADVAGSVNGTAPHPVTNAEFTAALNDALGRPAVLGLPVPGLRLPGSVLHVPTPALRLALGQMSGELLASARVLPRRLLEAGYAFQHSDISSALAYALS